MTFFYFSKRANKNGNSFIFLKRCCFHLGDCRKMNLGAFLETYVGFLKNVILQLFSKYYQSYINLKVKSS